MTTSKGDKLTGLEELLDEFRIQARLTSSPMEQVAWKLAGDWLTPHIQQQKEREEKLHELVLEIQHDEWQSVLNPMGCKPSCLRCKFEAAILGGE